VLDAAQNRLLTLRALAELRWQTINKPSEDEAELIVRTGSEVLAALSDNLNTPGVLEVLSELVDQLLPNGISPASRESFRQLLGQLDNWLGLNLAETTPDIDSAVKELIKDREAARQSGDFARADELRAKLLQDHKTEVRDTPNGPLWHRLA
jgi:cysteinyl-tRNA synthetase